MDAAMAMSSGDQGVVLGLVAALLLGLRHATDPDHLTAVATLALSRPGWGARRAGLLGAAWGLGHGATFLALGLAFLSLGTELPPGVRGAAEVAIGAVIVVLALRLLLRWRRGVFHSHPHTHGALRHSHPHLHEPAGGDSHPHPLPHGHDHSLGRSPLAAFGVGLLHGAGGSAALGALVVASAPSRGAGAAALVAFAAATVLAMAAVSAGLGLALQRGPLARGLARAVPALGLASLAFGVWYAAAAL